MGYGEPSYRCLIGSVGSEISLESYGRTSDLKSIDNGDISLVVTTNFVHVFIE